MLIPRRFSKRHCLKFGIYFMLITCLHLEIETGKTYHYIRKAKSASHLHFTVMSVVFMWGAYIFMGARCGCCSQSMGAYYPNFMTWKKAVGDLIFSHTHFGFDRLEDLQLEVHNWFGLLSVEDHLLC